MRSRFSTSFCFSAFGRVAMSLGRSHRRYRLLPLAEFFQVRMYRLGDESKHHAIVEISDHRDEIGDDIDGIKKVEEPHDRHHDRLPWHRFVKSVPPGAHEAP